MVVDETTAKPPLEEGEEEVRESFDSSQDKATESEEGSEEETKVRFNEEHHLWLEDARKIKKDAQVGDELTFPLETKDDFGRIAAQTAKQVIIQRLREAEKDSVLEEFGNREGEIVSGTVHKIERGNVFIDVGRTTAILPYEEQVRGEFYRQGERIKAYLYLVEDTPRGVTLRLSRTNPKLVEKLFATEAPEVASGTVEIKAIAREAGARTKLAVTSHDPSVDPVGSMVGQRGSRVNTVIQELAGEKIDIIEWSDNPVQFIEHALSPAKASDINLNEEQKMATVTVPPDQFSLAVGKGGQNVRLAARLTGWKIDIVNPEGYENNPKPIEENQGDDKIEDNKVDDIKSANEKKDDE
ncbi:MAG: transcription termination factor NusA [Candidatus Vogelbacteria bacterium GWA1_51_14]|uniref:Transcription termination/antitermination protein NusA n=1 Tax=Candidatus Vogelbacteria bacterium GWA1_51_14 TaxID=1802435 RepID=A0A1G2Q8Q9_9BACT|nr:MAG: transcription termination factor NusA [Candidatus Vogelbacteria bacterium GWA1_51_14]